MSSERLASRKAMFGVALLALICAIPVLAQTIDSSQWKELKWRLVGPSRGGRALAVTGVAGNPNVYYFGAVAGGVWKTTDAGVTWTPLTDTTDIRSIGAIEAAPSDPNVIYVGTGEACIRGDISFGNGMYKSTDAGKTWTHLGLDDTRHIGRVAVDPNNADVVLVAALGHAFGPNEQRGIYRTADGGKTWTKVLYKDDKSGGIDVVFDPKNPRIAFASLWQAVRTPWSMSSGGPGSGIYKSTDGGLTWKQVTGHGLPTGVMGRIGVAVSRADDNRIYAAVEAERGGVYRSDDGGDNWRMMNDSHDLTQRAWYYMHIFADPNNVDTVYVLNTSIQRSTDGGKTFTAVRDPHGDTHGLWIDPTNSNWFINSNDGGATITHDAGKTWSTQQNQPTAEFYHVDTDTRFPYYLYGAQQDNSTVAIPSHTAGFGFGGGGGASYYDVGGGESGWVVPDPKDAQITFAGSYGGLLTEYNHDTGLSRDINPWPLNPMGAGAADLVHRFQWTFPIATSPHDPNTLYIGGEVVFKSTDRGSSWTAISKDLTRNDKSKQASSGGPITQDNTAVEYYDTVFCIAESPITAGEIWAGTDDGKVDVTRDDGKTWNDVTPKGIPEWIKVSIVDPSPLQDGTAYVALDGEKLDDMRPYLYKTTDYGKTWTKITNGIPDGAFTHSIKSDTKRKGLLFAGTESGVYVSFDDGANWQSLRLNMPDTPVHDLKVAGDDLVIATHGRSFYSLDDIAPLREFNDQMTSADAHLFTPSVAYRTQALGQAGGIAVDYWLKAAPKDPITLDITDAQGKLVRHFTSQPPARQEAPDPLEEEFPFLRRPSTTLPTAVGFNRFRWNLQLDAPTRVPGAVYWGGRETGVEIVPGTYHLKLTADGKSYESTVELKEDPRLHVSEADLEKQYQFVTQVNGRISLGHQTINDIRGLRKQLQDLRDRLPKTPENKPVLDAADALDKKMTEVEEGLIQTKAKSGEDALNFPIRVMNQMVDLANVAQESDAAPTAQSYQVYEVLNKELDVQLAKWKEVQSTELVALNQKMREANVPGVSIPPAKPNEPAPGRRRGN
jgi:photosystem II stability/assembly factor-like uncharacterized protein